MEIQKDIVLDLLDQQSPALSSTGDVPVVETKPDSQAAEPENKPEPEQPVGSAPTATDEPPGFRRRSTG